MKCVRILPVFGFSFVEQSSANEWKISTLFFPITFFSLMRNKLRRARGVQPNRSASQLNRFREQTNRTQLIGDKNESFAYAMHQYYSQCGAPRTTRQNLCKKRSGHTDNDMRIMWLLRLQFTTYSIDCAHSVHEIPTYRTAYTCHTFTIHLCSRYLRSLSLSHTHTLSGFCSFSVSCVLELRLHVKYVCTAVCGMP